MSGEDWRKPLRENAAHLATAFLFVCIIIYDFAPIATMIFIMRISEWLTQDKHYFVLGVELHDIMYDVEVCLLLAFMAVGGLGVLVRLGLGFYTLVRGK